MKERKSKAKGKRQKLNPATTNFGKDDNRQRPRTSQKAKRKVQKAKLKPSNLQLRKIPRQSKATAPLPFRLVMGLEHTHGDESSSPPWGRGWTAAGVFTSRGGPGEGVPPTRALAFDGGISLCPVREGLRARFLASLGMTESLLPFALCLLRCSFGFAFCALRFDLSCWGLACCTYWERTSS